MFASLMRRIVAVHLLWAADFKDYVTEINDLYPTLEEIKINHHFRVYARKSPFEHWR